MRPSLANFLKNPHPFLPLSMRIFRPPTIARVQTDGSYKNQISRTAVLLKTRDNIDYTLINTYFDHLNSTEAEWVSVLNGIQYALKKDQGSVELENDCLPVIKHLIHKRPPAKSYLVTHYTAILKEARYMDYLGVRWIPREFNKADDLFHI